jgi:hypothetical protein
MLILHEEVSLERVEALVRRYGLATRFRLRIHREPSRSSRGQNGWPALRV